MFNEPGADIIVNNIMNGTLFSIAVSSRTEEDINNLKQWLRQFCDVRMSISCMPDNSYQASMWVPPVNASSVGETVRRRELVIGTLKGCPLHIELIRTHVTQT